MFFKLFNHQTEREFKKIFLFLQRKRREKVSPPDNG